MTFNRYSLLYFGALFVAGWHLWNVIHGPHRVASALVVIGCALIVESTRKRVFIG